MKTKYNACRVVVCQKREIGARVLCENEEFQGFNLHGVNISES